MALQASTVFECRVAGSRFNGGGFNPARVGAGTDYSQQDAAQLTVTDGVTTGTTALTSATGGFTAAMVGNVVGLVQAATFRGFWEIVAFVNSNEVTLDSIPTTWTAITVRVGGAHIISDGGIPCLNAITPVAGFKIWVKGPGAASGDYSLTVNAVTGDEVNPATQPITIEGYTTTRGDGGRPSLKGATGTTNVLLLSGAFFIVKNLTLNNSAGTLPAMQITGVRNYVENVIAKNADMCAYVTGADNYLRRCWFQGSTGSSPGVRITAAGNVLEHCVVSGSTAEGIRADVSAQIRHCLVYGNTTDGISYIVTGVNGQSVIGNVIWNNGRDGIRIASTAATGGLANYVIHRNIIGKHAAGYDINYSPSNISAQTGTIEWSKAHLRCNVFYTTGLGRYNQLPANATDTALTISPFTSDTNFALNNETGGGATLRGLACTVTYPDDVNTGSYPFGALGSISAEAVVADARSLWREYTGEKDITVVPDSIVDIYIQAGIDELNRRIEYHLTDDSSSIVLVSGTQEYALPTDAVKIVWVQWNGKDLQKRSIDDWRNRELDWRNEVGQPQEWAMYANKLVLRPIPIAAAVAAAASPVIRYISRPGAVATVGFAQLNTQDHRVPVYWGVYQWSVAYPDSALAQQRATQFLGAFTSAAQEIGRSYSERGLLK